MVKDKIKWEKTKKEVKKELKTKWFWVYLVFMILFAIIFIKSQIETLKIVSLFIIIIVQIIYNTNQDYKNKLRWAYVVIFIFYFVIYTSLKVGELNITIMTIIFFTYISIGWGMINSYLNLKQSKKLPWIIFNYTLFVTLIILLFSVIFVMVSIGEDNKILNSDGNKITGAKEFIWFSSGNFFITNFGERPFGWSKSISYIEMLLSFIIHSILIVKIIGSQENKSKKTK